MRIWLVTVGEPLPRWSGQARLWRTGLLAEELTRRGHDVTWWTSSVNHFTKQYFVIGSERHRVSERLAIQFMHGKLYTRNISFARLLNHRQIAKEFAVISAKETPPDLIWCSLPTIELSEAVVAFGGRHDVSTLIDIRDLWPDEIERRIPMPIRRLAKLALYPMRNQVRRALRAATGITAISQQYLSWGLEHAERSRGPHDGVFPMGYPANPSADVPAHLGKRFLAMGVDPARKIFWFAGNFVSSADLETVISAARLLSHDAQVQFVLTGAGENDQRLRALANGLENVVFTGWVDRAELAWLASTAWAGLVAYKKGALQSLPNKIFEYMSFRLPVLVSLEGEAKALVGSEEIGMYYSAGSPRELAEKVSALVADPSLRGRQAANARELVNARFSAAAVYPGLADFLEANGGRAALVG